MSLFSRVLLLLFLSSIVATVTSQRLCGRRLTEALSVVCDHKYHRPTREQLNTVRTHSSGIATKCCRNRCPYEELSKYCSSTKVRNDFTSVYRGTHLPPLKSRSCDHRMTSYTSHPGPHCALDG